VVVLPVLVVERELPRDVEFVERLSGERVDPILREEPVAVLVARSSVLDLFGEELAHAITVK
jgi:hypothetical protein